MLRLRPGHSHAAIRARLAGFGGTKPLPLRQLGVGHDQIEKRL
jgi:hypothetical protein